MISTAVLLLQPLLRTTEGINFQGLPAKRFMHQGIAVYSAQDAAQGLSLIPYIYIYKVISMFVYSYIIYLWLS